ncbi:MAG: hypothetical protein KKA31_05620 [Candidatus Margulisbacteria bacterium]|nr:hypothetical protein [Candidatus Margulisiibacteriota bacterium]
MIGPKQKAPSSTIILLLANLFPIYGVLFNGWHIVDILFLYWAESAVIGFFNILKMLTSKIEKGDSVILTVLMRGAASLFFTVHFGGFMLVHGIFIFAIAAEFYAQPIHPLALLSDTWIAIVCLFLSHGQSYITNYWINRERDNSQTGMLMAQPYARIIIMQLTLIFGLMLTMIFGQPIFLLLLFVVLKMIVDLSAHLRERIKFNALCYY